MSYSSIISILDAEISRLQEARKLLSHIPSVPDISAPVEPTAPRPGRPKGSKNAKNVNEEKRQMSAEARARIAEAQRKRHAARKELTAGE